MSAPRFYDVELLSLWISYYKTFCSLTSHEDLISHFPDTPEEFKLLVGAFLKFEELISK